MRKKHVLTNNEKLTLHTIRNPSQMAAAYLDSLFIRYSQKAILFLVSSGSALEILKYIDTKLISNRCTVGVLDERYSTDPAVSNYAQLSATEFFQKAKENGARTIFTFPLYNETQKGLADRWETSLRSWRRDNINGVVIITQGIGTDGHTAGVMSYPEDPKTFEKLFRGDNWVASYNASGKNPYPLRVTTTLSFLKTVNHSIVFVKGIEKAEILKKVMASSGVLHKVPARLIHHMKQVDLFTDIKI